MYARLRPFLPTTGLVLLIVYFAFHAMTGDRGLLLWSARSETLAVKSAQLNKLKAQRMDMEARAQLLRDGSLSRDLLEERARSLLGFADPRDYVIRTNP